MKPARLLIAWGAVAPLCAYGDQNLVFVNVTSASGLSYGGSETARVAVAVGDYNNDGWPDLSLTGSSAYKTRLYRNNGDGTFSEVTTSALPANMPNGGGVAFADLDNDGDCEFLLVRAYGNLNDVGLIYYDNLGGIFGGAVPATPLGRYAAQFGGMAVGDVDGDGDLDVVFAHNQGPAYFLRNMGGGVLVDDSTFFDSDLSSVENFWSATMADFNEDGRLDLHIAVDEPSKHDLHYLQQSDGSFVNSAVVSGISAGGNDMGVAVGDIDNDGDFDFYSTNIARQVLYVNDGTGVFADEAVERGVAYSDMGGFACTAWGTVLADFDNDCDQDLAFVASGDRGAVFENDGTGHFTGASAGCGVVTYGSALARFDYDRDGDLDLLLTRSDGKAVLYANVSPAAEANHWLAVKLHGRESNIEGIGARVNVTSDDVTQFQQMLASGSYVTALLPEVHFGLGSAAAAEYVVVKWPSGRQSVRANVAGDQVLRIVEADVGDLNCDGQVNLFDIDPFVSALESAAGQPPFADYYASHPSCDVWLADGDLNGTIDWLDIDPFVQLLTGR